MTDRKALIARLFAEQGRGLRAFFSRRIRSRSDLNDLVQEVYARMLRVQDVDAIRNPEGYLYTIAGNLVYEEAVLGKRRERAELLDVSELSDQLVAAGSQEELVDARVRAARLHEVLQGLSAKCRAVVYLRYQHELSYQEIASHLSISTQMVQKYLTHALTHCRRRMTRLG